MGKLRLARPAAKDKRAFEEMMAEWSAYGGRINPGVLREYLKPALAKQYAPWLDWIDRDRAMNQDLYFLWEEEALLGAISIRYRCAGIDGHTGFGIRPSARGKGYGTRMLALALPVLKGYGHNPVVVSCEKGNLGSVKVIQNNGGRWVEEALEEDTGYLIEIYHIDFERF